MKKRNLFKGIIFVFLLAFAFVGTLAVSTNVIFKNNSALKAKAATQYAVNFTEGVGVDTAFLTTTYNATSGSSSETTLETDEAESAQNTKTNRGVLITLLIISATIITLGGGYMLLVFYKYRRREIKVMSVGGLLPLIILTTHYVDASWILLYILGTIAILVLAAVGVLIYMQLKGLWIFNKDRQAALQEAIQESAKVNEAKEEEIIPEESDEEDEEDSIDVTDEAGNTFHIRFLKSFTAKLIQASDENKRYYQELKNEVLSYKNTTSRISWNYDSINSGRKQVLKFSIRRKTLCVYFPLDVDKLDTSKFKVEKVETKKFKDVPCLYRIKNDKRFKGAKELIALVAKMLGLTKGEPQNESYILPYEENKPLIERGLIKELKVQVEAPEVKPVQEEPVVLETKEDSNGDEIVTAKDSNGNIFQIRFIKSFSAKLSQSSDEVKAQYSELKNHVLSYKKANSRVSWHFDSVNLGKDKVLKFAIRGKTLCVYYPLNEVDDKYKVEMVESKKFEDTPCLYRIKNERRLGYAKELINMVMRKLHAELGKESHEDFSLPYEETKVLVKKGLIKELKVNLNEPKEVVHKPITVEEANKKMSDEKAQAQIKVEEKSKVYEGKKDIINIDIISENFKDGDKVTIEALWDKGLINKNVGFVKVLARGILDKKLTVELQDYSIEAVKMILLEGGEVKKIK